MSTHISQDDSLRDARRRGARAEVGAQATSGDDPSCRRRKRQLAPGSQRPADLLASFFIVALSFMLAGCVVAVLTALGLTGDYGNWLTLHLLLLGGVSQLVLGAGQFFSTAYLATDPPTRVMVRAQLAVWSGGVVLIAAGVPSGAHLAVAAGATLIVAGLALFASSLRNLEHRSLQTARWTIRWYYACASFLAAGAMIGALMAAHIAWTHGSLIGAHIALNLAGWLGTAIVGTLHTFYPSLARGRWRWPQLQGATFIGWCGGVATLALGEAFALSPVIAAGWIALTAASLMLVANIVGTLTSDSGAISLAGKLVSAGQGFLSLGLGTALAMLAINGPDAAIAGPWRAALGVLFAGGWVGLTVSGSMLHLLTVLSRVQNFYAKMPEPRPLLDTLQAVALSGALLLLAASKTSALTGAGEVARLLVVICAAPVAARILRLASRALPTQVRRIVKARAATRSARAA